MAHLITASAGQAHITPKSDASWHRGILGVESCILDYGEKLAPMLVPSQPTNIRILDGVGMFQGRFFEIESGSYDTIAIPNGAQGYSRIDLVCAKITQNENGTQTFSWEVVQGTQTEGTPAPPTVEEGSLDDGDEVALMPIASVELEGVNIAAVKTVALIITAGEHISLDTDASEGVDKELTDALTSLGWLSSVIDGMRGILNVKKLLKKLVNSSEIVSERVALVNAVSVPSHGIYGIGDVNITKNGYKPISVHIFTSSAYCVCNTRIEMENNVCKFVDMYLGNFSTSDRSPITDAVITWQKL